MASYLCRQMAAGCCAAAPILPSPQPNVQHGGVFVLSIEKLGFVISKVSQCQNNRAKIKKRAFITGLQLSAISLFKLWLARYNLLAMSDGPLNSFLPLGK